MEKLQNKEILDVIDKIVSSLHANMGVFIIKNNIRYSIRRNIYGSYTFLALGQENSKILVLNYDELNNTINNMFEDVTSYKIRSTSIFTITLE